MDFIKENYGDIAIQTVNLTRATLKEAEEFKKILTADIDSGTRKLVVDLSECEFIDSTFLGALVVSLKKITSMGGDLRLVGFQPAVHSMFELTRMYRVFEAYPTKLEAVESFKFKSARQ
ncbi:MAG: STAS domain-containing protein [Ignavibacteriaceae bacterium]|nr:STAS domain-containing protein [Ignavibacteriaceae bacterium]